MIIIESRYSEGWICININPEDLDDKCFDGLNCDDWGHSQFMARVHNFPMGIGSTPNEALSCFERERDKFNADINSYSCSLDSMLFPNAG